jgi:hypothetical protein
MDIKEKTKERMELRLYAEETLRTVMEWMRAVKPSEWIPQQSKGEDIIPSDLVKAQWREYVDKGGAVIGKAWKILELSIDDLISFMEQCYARPANPPESK